MGRGTWYCSLGVSSVVDAFVRSEFGISSWRGSRVDGRSYLLSGAIDDSEANRIIRDSKLEFKNSRFTPRRRMGFRMELVQGATPICEGSCRLMSLERQEEWNDLQELARVHGDDVAKTVFRMRNGHVEVYGYAFWVNQCTSGFHGVNEPGEEYESHVKMIVESLKERNDTEVFQQRGSGAKRKLSRCGRILQKINGKEPILLVRKEQTIS
ncbi:hypothetical protein Tco_1383418 [Tanacetum coccineum]